MSQLDGGFNEAADPACSCQAWKQANKVLPHMFSCHIPVYRGIVPVFDQYPEISRIQEKTIDQAKIYVPYGSIACTKQFSHQEKQNDSNFKLKIHIVTSKSCLSCSESVRCMHPTLRDASPWNIAYCSPLVMANPSQLRHFLLNSTVFTLLCLRNSAIFEICHVFRYLDIH